MSSTARNPWWSRLFLGSALPLRSDGCAQLLQLHFVLRGGDVVVDVPVLIVAIQSVIFTLQPHEHRLGHRFHQWHVLVRVHVTDAQGFLCKNSLRFYLLNVSFILKLFYFANKISLIFSEVKNKINKYVLQTQAVLVNKFKNISKEMH